MNVPARDAAGHSPDLGRPAQLKESGHCSAGYTRALHPHTHSTPLFGPAANLTPSATSRRRRSNRSGPHSRPAPRRGRPLPWTSKLPTRAPPAARPALNCQPGRPHRTARDYPVQHSRPYYRATPARPFRGYACPAQLQPRQLIGPGGPRQHQLPSGPSAAPGAESSQRAIHLQPTRRRAPGKAEGLPGFDAGHRMGGAAPHGPPQAADLPAAAAPPLYQKR